jgi:hypothetical protein
MIIRGTDCGLRLGPLIPFQEEKEKEDSLILD